jgi:diguanylate cyclase (GGDEF)-like protein
LAAASLVYGVVQLRTRGLRRRRVQLEHEVAERTKALAISNAELERLAHHDPLTGLGNRRRFLEITSDLLALARRHHRPCSVMMIDLDRFKRINDSFGHGGGDETLRRAADCLVGSLRGEDAIARFGGEEFAVFLPETALATASLAAERFRLSLEALEIPYEGTVIRVTASIGVASWHEAEAGIGPALERADAALYRVKQAGRNGVGVEPADPPAAPAGGSAA